MKKHRMACLPVMLLVLCFAAEAGAFPGPPSSLEELWASATHVVQGNVDSVQEVEHGQNVILSTLEILKCPPGEELPKTLAVKTRYGGCPYPYVFRAGTKVIAFLVFDPDHKAYSPWGAERGCIEVDDQQYKSYATLLQKLPGILKLPPVERQPMLLNWYCESAIDPTTRWEGVWGISKMMQSTTGQRLLVTRVHRDRLVDILVAEKTPGKDSAALASILDWHPSPKFDAYLLESLRQSHMPGWQQVSHVAVDSLPRRLGIKLSPAAQTKYEAWEEQVSILNELEYEDEQPEPKRIEREKEQLAMLWGALSAEVYQQCKQGLDQRK